MKIHLRSALSLAFVALALFASGCAYTPQTVTFAPQATVLVSNAGAGTSVSVKVADERDSTAIGHRGSAYGKAASIASNQNLAAIIETELVKGLRDQGFNANAQTPSTDSNLEVELRLLSYDTSTGMWTGGVHIRATLKAKATRGTGSYEQTYRTEREERVSVVPTAEKNQAWLNESLNEVITQLLSDPKLIKFLATKP